MKRSQLEQIIREELEKELQERANQSWLTPSKTEEEVHLKPHQVHEKSVPEPYNRNSPPRRKMTKSQISKRDKVGKAMLKNKNLVTKYKNKFEGDWKDYIWASASSKVLGRRKKK